MILFPFVESLGSTGMRKARAQGSELMDAAGSQARAGAGVGAEAVAAGTGPRGMSEAEVGAVSPEPPSGDGALDGPPGW